MHLAATLLAGLMCLFEISAALCTIIRSIQALLVDDPVLTPKGGMVYLLLEQGTTTKFLNAIRCLQTTLALSGIVYFMSVLIQ